MNNFKKITQTLSVILLCILFFTACGENNNKAEEDFIIEEFEEKEKSSDNSNDKDSDNEVFSTGRFVQTDITPPDIHNATPIHFTQGENEEYLLSIYEEEQKIPKAFSYINDVWIEKNNDPIVAFLEGKTFSKVTAFSDFADNWWAFLIEEGVTKGYKISKEGSVQDLSIPTINDTVSINSILVSTSEIIGLKIVSSDGFEVVNLLIDGKTGNIMEYKLPSNETPFQLTGTTAFVKDDMTVTSYDIYSGETLDSSTLPIRLIGGSKFYSNKIGDLFYADAKGIHKINKDGSLVQTVIDERGFAYADPTMDNMTQRIYEREIGGTYIMACNVQENVKVFEYSFDENLVTNKSDGLSIWALSDSDYLQQGIAFFSQQFPECEVNLEIGREGYDFSSYFTEKNEEKLLDFARIDSDIIRNLNAKLLAGEAPDVLFLDGLSIDSMIQHGMLSELALELDETQYYENVMSSYSVGEKVYAYPTSFSIPVFVSSDSSSDVTAQYSMEDIVALYKDPTTIIREVYERRFFESFCNSL